MWFRSGPPPPPTESASLALNRSVAARAPLDEVRRWMANRRLEAVYVTRPVSIAYLTGFHAEPHERLMALAVRPDGATLIVPALEKDSAIAKSKQVEVLGWRDGEDPYDLVRDALDGSARLGVEKEHLTVRSAEALSAKAAVKELVDLAPAIRRLRRTKSSDELTALGAHASSP